MENKKIRVGITQGDYNGIGSELIIKTFLDNRMLELCTPVIYASQRTLWYHRKTIKEAHNFNYFTINAASEVRSKRVNVINCSNEEPLVELGTPTEISTQVAAASLKQARMDINENLIDVLVLSPPCSPNHNNASVSVLLSDCLRISVLKNPTKQTLFDRLQLMTTLLLQDFGIRKARIAVVGTAPKNDNEKEAEIKSAIQQANEKGMVCVGMLSPQDLSASGNLSNYDGLIVSSDEQANELLKDKTVIDYSFGLPFVQIAPVYGNAYELAGKDQISTDAFRNAIYTACDIYKNRKLYQEISQNPLRKQHFEKGSEPEE